MKSLRIAVSVAVLSTLFACPPPDPKEIAEKTAKDTSALIREAWQSGEQTNDWQSVDKFFEGVFGVRRSRSGSAIYVPAVSNFDTASDTAGGALTRVFDKANVVKTEGNSVFFRVRGVDLCVDSSGLVNSSCADVIDRMTPQLRVSGDLDIAVLLGTNQVEAAVVHLVSKKSIAVDLDLARAKEVAELIQRAINPQATTSFSTTASGKLQVKLEKNKDYDFTVSVSFLSDLSVTWQAGSFANRTYSMQARNPAVRVQVDAPAKRVTAKLDFGNVRYSGKGEEFALSYGNAVSIEALLAGFTADFLLDDANLKLSNVSLGGSTSTLKAGSATVLQLDLNAALGRKVDLSAVHTTDGIRVSATPGLMVDATTHFGALADDDFNISEELRDMKYAVSFTGGVPALDFFLRRIANGESGLPFARIVDGVLKVKVDALSAPSTDNVAVCNAMKNRSAPYEYWFSDCGGLTAPIDCSGLTLNAYENTYYVSCHVGAYECQSTWNSTTSSYDYSYTHNATRASECQLLGDRAVPERTFTASTCLTSDSATSNNMVGFFTGTTTCP